MTVSTFERMKALRQTRSFTGEPIDDASLKQILEAARWTGSSRNAQPWQLVVIDDREQLQRIAHIRTGNEWSEHAAVAIALVAIEHDPASDFYDQGRMTERIMLAADELGLGVGTCWFGNDEQYAQAKDLLGVPQELGLRSMVVIGHMSPQPPAARSKVRGRKPLEEIVSYNTFGKRTRD